MENKTVYLGKAIYIGAFLMLGCSSSGVLGCGSSAEGPTVDSELLGVYQVDRYQVTPADSQDNPDVCNQLSDSDLQPAYFVLYAFRPVDDPEESLLGGVFCNDVDRCREVAREAPEPTLGYSFLSGNDQSGWLGWGIQDQAVSTDQCRVDVQAHTLTSTAETIDIQTRTLRTEFEPRPEDIDGNNITCRIADAIAFLDDNLPCVGAFSLEATFEASL